jgi:hypothetical protein
MGFVQHIKAIILPENYSSNKAEEENEKKTKDLQKNSCFEFSFVGVWTFSICNLRFVQQIKAIILIEDGGHRNSQKENEKKIKDL